MDDSGLYECNETELLCMARAQGLGILRRGLPRELLVAIVAGYEPMKDEYLADTVDTRAALEAFIERRIEQVRSQLPGCTGKCTTYGCSDGRHALCIGGNENVVVSDGRQR